MEDLSRAFRGKTVFVTGGTGFLGAWLVHALLQAEARVVCLVRDVDPEGEFSRAQLDRKVLVIPGELQRDGLMERVFNLYEPEIVFHLGAQTLVQPAFRSPLETMDSNIRGTYVLLEAARRIRSASSIVIASSDKAYGTLHADKYIETDPLAGEHPYDVSKSCTDLIARMYYVTYGLPVTISRCGNIYGGGDTNWSRIVPGTIRSLIRGERPVLRSDGTMVRDYLHVSDVVRAYLLLSTKISDPRVAGAAFNFSAGEALSVSEVVSRIQSVMGRKDLTPIIQGGAHSEIPTQVLDSRKATDVLGWSPHMTFDNGLREAVSWYAGAQAKS